MIYPYSLILLLGLMGCSSRYVSPSLLPTSVEKTIYRLNYCLNQIKHPKIFQTLDNILIGKAKKEFRELSFIFNQLRPGQNTGNVSSSGISTSTSSISSSSTSGSNASIGVTSRKFKKELELYTLYAQSLKIKILSVKYNKNKAVAETIFFDSHLILEERKRILLEKEDRLWKIKEIIAISEGDGD
ncbi:MAG: hypothetical protein IEMM0008_1532 [bacterium]|nr:MAG: hypothetical protein IEMM0008_1532 [bacterium]